MDDATAMYERSALILDDEVQTLGGLSLSMISMGLRPLYTSDLDELVLLAREYRDSVGAVLLCADELSQSLPALRKRVLEPLALPLAAVVPIGALPADVGEALRQEGMRFCLRTPYEAHELRFIVARVLSETDPDELRFDSRVPCEIPVTIESEHRRVVGRLGDVSTLGAFVAIAHPHAKHSLITLRFTLCGQECSAAARVAWRTGPDAPPWLDRGMGVEFVDIDEAARGLLRRTVAEQLARFRLGAGEASPS